MASCSSGNSVPFFGGIKYDTTPRCFIIGAGSRGAGYARLALEDPGALFIAGVAEPDEKRRAAFVAEHNLPEDRAHADWPELLERAGEADFALVATQDADHYKPSMAALKAGLHVLVEKPMATTDVECVLMQKCAEEHGRMLGVCHVLRYTPYTQKIKDLIAKGYIGEVRSMNLIEPVGNWHFAHSYVRGNWRRSATSSPVLMAKSCHDIDWMLHVTEAEATRVSCVGEQLEFTHEQKPAAAGDAMRCTDCAYAKDCPYDARKIYVETAEDKGMNNEHPMRARFPNGALVSGPALLSDIEDAVQKGPYGRCVYECDNDQPDTVSAIFSLKTAKGKPIQVTFEMRALTEDICKREVTICGTKGEIRGDMTTISLAEFRGGAKDLRKTKFHMEGLPREETQLSGHWGADWYMMNAWCAAVAKNSPELVAQAPESVRSHLTVFAAEQARRSLNRVLIAPYVEHMQHLALPQ